MAMMNFEHIPHEDLREGLVRDERLAEIPHEEFIGLLFEATKTQASPEDLEKLSEECIFRGIVLNNNGIILGLKEVH
mgnify:CR=1 FL=1